jgi:hypothetical protein
MDVTQAIRGRSADGRLTLLDTSLPERCSDGSELTFRWFPGLQRLVQHGEHVDGRSVGSSRGENGRTIAWDNQVWASLGARPHGTIRARTTKPTARGTVRCDSGPVTFTMQRLP